ncbi:MAG: hypothetical protein WDO14_19260 [Bacteroidota bacterium]
MKHFIFLLAVLFFPPYGFAQEITFQKQKFEANAVKAEVVKLNGEQVLKVERDLNIIPFDAKNLGATVDEPSYVKLTDVDLQDGVIEVKMLSKIQDPSPFDAAQGFIGLAFRIAEKDSAYESIYIRPKVARTDSQLGRNHVVQYYSYPNYKFDRLRKDSPGLYETYADVGLNEWITFRIELEGGKARLFINNQRYASFVVEKMKGTTRNGSVALWVDIGTIGYFKDLKIITHE